MTYDVLKEIEYGVGFIFGYSPRNGTPAMRWKDDISEEVKDSRVHRLLELQEGINNKKRRELLGTEVEVLVESVSMKDDLMLKGRTRCWKNVLFPGDPSLIGTLQQVKVHSYSHQTLLGDRIQGNALKITG